MTHKRLPRLGVLLVGICAFAALFSSVAAAAGKPEIKLKAVTSGINEIIVNREINPNGASTTYKLEYGPTEALGSSTEVTELKGLSWEPVQQVVGGLYPRKTYYYRVSATNSYGTTTEAIQKKNTSRWQYGTLPTETFVGSGNLTMYLPTFGELKISCNVAFSGAIGSKGGVEDSFNPQVSGCVNAKTGEACNYNPISSQLAPNFGEKGAFFISLQGGSPACSAFSKVELKLWTPFKMEHKFCVPGAPPGGEVNGEASAFYGSNPVQISITSMWYVTGANFGHCINWGEW